MEAAVSAHAVSSNWWLGLGRQRGVVGSRKQSLLLLSIDGVGYTRKMMMKRRNNMICMRRSRLESSWMGPRAIERQRFKLEASTSASGSRSSAQAQAQAQAQGEEDVENIVVPAVASVLPYVAVACVGVGAVMLGIGYHLGYLLSSNTTTGITYTTTVAARVLVVAANIIGTTIASSFLDMLGRKGLLPTSFSRMINFTGDDYLLLNAKSSDDVDTFARVIALKIAGIPPEKAQVLGEETKDLPQSKFNKLLRTIRLDQQHKKETKAWRAKELVEWIICFFGAGKMGGSDWPDTAHRANCTCKSHARVVRYIWV